MDPTLNLPPFPLISALIRLVTTLFTEAAQPEAVKAADDRLSCKEAERILQEQRDRLEALTAQQAALQAQAETLIARVAILTAISVAAAALVTASFGLLPVLIAAAIAAAVELAAGIVEANRNGEEQARLGTAIADQQAEIRIQEAEVAEVCAAVA
ncbi:MAG: hypothetical protein AAFY59_11890 [Pseudomonadota bacterium]